MINLNERSVAFAFKHNLIIRKLVMLVLISINHLLPTQEQQHQQQLEDDSLPEPQTDLV
jgi:hypothetical protein